jgi:crossover junction endodeoxyribonuclease RuvC
MILGLDVATRCGWAYGDGSALPTFGTYEGLPCGDDLRPYFRAFRNWLRDLILRLKAEAEAKGQTLRVIFEAPVFPKPFIKQVPGRKPQIVQHASIKDRRRLYGLVAIVELVCGDLGVNPYEEPVQALKQALTGRGDAEKDDMVRAARKMGAAVQYHDEADAIAAWLIGVRIYHRKHLHHWDALLYGRGAGALL